jgi:hypothetical protein
MPGCPQLYFGVVDVRDVADLHIRAMTHPVAKGERFIAVSGDAKVMLDIAKTLKARLGNAAKRVPTPELANWLVRLVGRFSPSVRPLVPLLGNIRNAAHGGGGRGGNVNADDCLANSAIVSIIRKRSKGFATKYWNPALSARSLLLAQDIAMAGVNPPSFGARQRTRAMKS